MTVDSERIMKTYNRILLSIIIAYTSSFSISNSSPWANPGDETLRSDVEILASYGLISGPVDHWPLSWKQITSGFYKADSTDLPIFVMRALERVKSKIPNKINVRTKALYTNQVQFFRGFEDETRGETEIEGGFEFNLEKTSIHIEGRYNDVNNFNLDGSYLSHEIGNWSTYIGSVNRWWGPGQETTTLLSTNARPMPSIGIRRVAPKPFKTKWLSWMGPWDAEIFISKMDKDRVIPEPIFVGMRLNFEPIDNFEIGVSRTLMLCGRDRPCGFNQWANGLIALGDLDNFGDGPDAVKNQPGNQLAALTLSYSYSLREDLNLKLYLEGAAEDLVVIVPYTYSRLIGATLDGAFGDDGSKWKITAEASDTSGSLAWFYGEHRKGVMYNHFIYNSGYRYYNQVIGHSLDSNSVYYSLKASVVNSRGLEYGAKFQNILVNTEGDTKNFLSLTRERINSLNLFISSQTPIGEFRIDARLMDNNINTPTENKVNFRGGISWEVAF